MPEYHRAPETVVQEVNPVYYQGMLLSSVIEAAKHMEVRPDKGKRLPYGACSGIEVRSMVWLHVTPKAKVCVRLD